MQREIKFRGFSEITNSIFYNDKKIPLWEFLRSVDGCTLEQFTGLQDKNGVDIYEGDVLQFPKLNTGVVKIETSGVCAVGFECFITNRSFHICEVIGNIHKK